jgi:flagellar FliL protein
MATKTDDAAEAPAKGGKKKLLILIPVLLLIAGAFYFFMGPSSDSKAAEKPVAGTVLSLEPVTVNLAGGGYLKISVALQFTADASAGEEKPDGSKATDIIIAQFSQADPNAVNNARAQMKQSLQDQIVKAYDGAVYAIYLTNYVTQ